MKTVAVMACVAATMMAVSTAFSHHSASMFEPTKTVTLTGVVKEFQYTNPHSWLIVSVTCIGGFMGQVDASIVQLALPTWDACSTPPWRA